MKHYIFLSYITGAGGVQCYVASKAKYLEECGWHVLVFSPYTTEKCLIPYLSKFLGCEISNLEFQPHRLPYFIVNKTLSKIEEMVGTIQKDDITIIESWNSSSALWGELLAIRLQGRHFFWTANEYYRYKGQSYEEKIDFYKFKMDRGEILATNHSINKLFEGYRKYDVGSFLEHKITENPIQEYKNEKVDGIARKDWNICYIGRSQKPYVPNIINGVRKFASQHEDKTIQFIMVGETVSIRSLLEEVKLPNLIIIELGDQFPLPLSLYSKADVIIAGSGAARHSADEGALVITVDSETLNSHGLLGYDTNESISIRGYDESVLNLTFEEALERALVNQTWRQLPNKWVKSPSVAECTTIQFNIIDNADKELRYYDIKKLLKGSVDVKAVSRILYRQIRGKLS